MELIDGLERFSVLLSPVLFTGFPGSGEQDHAIMFSLLVKDRKAERSVSALVHRSPSSIPFGDERAGGAEFIRKSGGDFRVHRNYLEDMIAQALAEYSLPLGEAWFCRVSTSAL